MMFKCTKKVKQGLALFLALLMMLFITDLSGVKVRADDEEWKSDSIELKEIIVTGRYYGDDIEIKATVETTDENAVVTYKWYIDDVELDGRTSSTEVLTVDEYKSAGDHTLKCEATCGTDTVTRSIMFKMPQRVLGEAYHPSSYRFVKDYNGKTDVPSEWLPSTFSFEDIAAGTGTIKLERDKDYTVEGNYDSPEVGEHKDIFLKFTLINDNYIFEGNQKEKEITVYGKDNAVTLNPYIIGTLGYSLTLDDCKGVNLADYLPELTEPMEYGEISYRISEIEGLDGWYDYDTDGAKIENGVLTVPLNEPDTPDVGEIGRVRVSVDTTNFYIAYYFFIEAPKLIPTGAPTLNTTSITYGDKLSDIQLWGGLKYKDSYVSGTFEWVEPDAKPDKAGIYTAEWVFKPFLYNTYEEVTGTAEITVNKAVPKVTELPTVAARDYDSSKTLDDSDLAGGTVIGVDGNTLSGTWSWQSKVVPTVDNEGYTAVFTPDDSTNYEQVTATVSVTVNKGTDTPNVPDNDNKQDTDDNTKDDTADNTNGSNNDNKQDADNNTNDNTTDSSKSGWEAVTSQIDSAKDGDTVTVEMNGATTVPSGVFEHLKDRDVKVLFNMGNGITWTVNGRDVTEIKGDINLGVTFGGEAGKTIPVDVVNSVTGEHYSVNLTLAYNGEFGFTATLTLNMKAENAGKYANLFYYNPTDNKLEFVSFGQVGNDGNVTFTFTHASDYTIVLADSVINRVESPSTGNDGDMWRSRMIVVLCCAFMAVGTGVFYTNRKKKAKQ